LALSHILAQPHLTSPLLSFSFNTPSTTPIYTLSLHDALPIWRSPPHKRWRPGRIWRRRGPLPQSRFLTCRSHCCFYKPRLCGSRSEEHTSELQSPYDLVCRLLLEKKKKKINKFNHKTDRNNLP